MHVAKSSFITAPVIEEPVNDAMFFVLTDMNEVRRVSCPEKALLQFPIRYLEWLMIARERSFDPNFRLTYRVDTLNEEARKNILKVRPVLFQCLGLTSRCVLCLKP